MRRWRATVPDRVCATAGCTNKAGETHHPDDPTGYICPRCWLMRKAEADAANGVRCATASCEGLPSHPNKEGSGRWCEPCYSRWRRAQAAKERERVNGPKPVYVPTFAHGVCSKDGCKNQAKKGRHDAQGRPLCHTHYEHQRQQALYDQGERCAKTGCKGLPAHHRKAGGYWCRSCYNREKKEEKKAKKE